MVQEEHRIFYGEEEATRELLKNMKPDKAPNRGLGIAELEKLRREEWQKGFLPGEIIFHPLNPQQNAIVPFLSGFDPSFPFECNVENFPMLGSQLLDSTQPVSSDGTLPLLWSSFQSDNSSSSNSQLSLATSEWKTPPRESPPLLILPKPEPHQQIPQVLNHSSLHSFPEEGLQMELEFPSNQSYYGIVTPSSWADEQLMMHQIVAMNHPWQNERVSVTEPIPISHPDCGTLMINGTQGTNFDCSIDTALSLHNVGVNLNSNHPTMKRNVASEEDIAAPIEGSALSLVCLPSIYNNGWSSKSVSLRQFSEMSATKRQIVATNHPWQNERVSVTEPIPISHPDCGTLMINGTQGTNFDCSINHPTMKRNVASEEDIAAPIEGSALSLVCLPSIYSNGWSSKSVSLLQFSEMSATKRQKKNKESEGRKASATPSDDLAFYNFMELPYIDYVAERDLIANKKRRRWEGSDAVDVDLKL